MRIVGGKHRGRRLEAPAGSDTRPTTDRNRESIFNILSHTNWGPSGDGPLDGAYVLDAFCGTGALGLEALSRGAVHATFFDLGRPALEVVRQNVATLREEPNSLILRADATRPPAPKHSCTLIFLDPPYGRGLAPKAMSALAASGWLADGAILLVEEAEGQVLDLPAGFCMLDDRRYGDSHVWFVEWVR